MSYKMQLLSSLQLGAMMAIKKLTWAGVWSWAWTPAGFFWERKDWDPSSQPFLLLCEVRKVGLITPHPDSLGLAHLPLSLTFTYSESQVPVGYFGSISEENRTSCCKLPLCTSSFPLLLPAQRQ